MRDAPWSAVAAATAFRPSFIRKSRESQNKQGGSCCYRTPRRASHVFHFTLNVHQKDGEPSLRPLVVRLFCRIHRLSMGESTSWLCVMTQLFSMNFIFFIINNHFPLDKTIL
jgi:hypothetical protein